MLLLLLACGSAPEPLDLPGDPAAFGVPVGVTTVEDGDQTLEVFYPAAQAHAEDAPEVFSYEAFVSDAVRERLEGLTLPGVEARVSRDAALRPGDAPYPAIFFSHGFGGMRTQSLDLAAHLASRGYVVISMDHPGRMLGDVLPCVFSPPLEGCDLGASFIEDPAVEDIEDGLDWLDGAVVDEDSFLFGAVDTERLGLTGHSAGGGTTMSLGGAEARFDALAPMAATGEVARDVPTMWMTGGCDYLFVSGDVDDAGTPEDASDDTVTLTATPTDALIASVDAVARGNGLNLHGTGHLAFSDLCSLDLGRIAEEQLAPRDDINPLILSQLIALATDGCPGTTMSPLVAAVPECQAGWLDLERAQEIVRGASTAFFDLHLRGEGQGPQASDEATWY